MSKNDDLGSSLHEEVPASQGSTKHYQSQFVVQSRKVKNPHQIQFYLNRGFSHSGPWLQIGVNDIEYGIGYEPGQTHKVSAPHPAQNLRVAPDLI